MTNQGQLTKHSSVNQVSTLLPKISLTWFRSSLKRNIWCLTLRMMSYQWRRTRKRISYASWASGFHIYVKLLALVKIGIFMFRFVRVILRTQLGWRTLFREWRQGQFWRRWKFHLCIWLPKSTTFYLSTIVLIIENTSYNLWRLWKIPILMIKSKVCCRTISGGKTLGTAMP